MPFNLVIQPLGREAFERIYDQSVVLIGRDMKSDLILQDTKNLVSREHAMIREKDGRFCLVDLKSKNKTKLNELILIPGKEHPLEEDDQIIIGDFKLVITSIHLPVKEKQVAPSHLSKKNQFEGDKRIEAVIADLNRTFDEHCHEGDEARKLHLLEVLRRSVQGLDYDNVAKLLTRVEASFHGPGYEKDVMTQSLYTDEKPLQEGEYEICQKAYNGCLKIAENYFDHHEAVSTSEGIDHFVERMDQVMSVMFASLANALKGRRQFEQEFDVEATRILSWRFNPVKECDSGEKIGAYLLDWRKEPSIDRVIADLEEGFNDLALHHLGLISGLNEGLRGLLDQLLPDTFEVESQKSQAVAGWMRPFIRFEPFRSWAAWKQFRKKYKALREEEVKTFETILGPYIAKGWLSVQKKKQAP